ncbi:MAG: hypothetical protein AB7K52_07465 [Phycisphaerales bacterium]
MNRIDRKTVGVAAPALLAMLAGSSALAQPVNAVLVVAQGDAIAGSTVSAVNAPFMDSTGAVGMVVSLADARRAIIRGTPGNFVSIFDSGMALPDALTGGESTMGISAANGFIYSPSFNGGDAVYTQAGKLLVDDDGAPGFPGLFSTFNSRPRMISNGTAYWVGGTATTLGGATSMRVLYRCTDPANPATISALIGGGDELAPGFVITAQGIGFDYDVSDDGMHLMGQFIRTGATTTTDDFIWADDVVVAVEGGPVGDGSNWVSFDLAGINNSGTTLFSADTSAATNMDRVLALNGAVILREGDVAGGLTLGAAIDAAAIGNAGDCVFIWDVTEATEALFHRSADGTVTRLAAVGDELNIDATPEAEFTLTDFNASGAVGPGLDLEGNGLVYAHVDLVPIGGGATIQAAVGFARPGVVPPCPADFNGDGNVDPDDLGDFINCYFSVPPCDGADFNGDGNIDPDDLGDFINVYFTTVGAGGC